MGEVVCLVAMEELLVGFLGGSVPQVDLAGVFNRHINWVVTSSF